MALRTFSCNPALGGFGGESLPHHDDHAQAKQADPGGDAFAQIVKELVDNAVDACSAADNSHGKRVRVSIEKANKSDEDGVDLLRVTVSDNGIGMKDVQRCVDPFRSSKQGNRAESESGGAEQEQKDNDEQQTVGRYGIGLTLCLLHGQRLVPNSSSQITSATAASSHWINTLWVVDTEDDSVKCIKQEYIAKTASKDESGTQVSLLLPGGATAERAWSRLEEYFNRFHLTIDLSCTVEVLAPSLSRVPLWIKPPKHRRAINDSSESVGSTDIAEDPGKPLVIHDAAQKYFGRQVELQNVAHDRVPIRIDATHPSQDTPHMEVSIIVLPSVDESVDVDEAAELGTDDQSTSESAPNQLAAQHGTIKLVRMVNNVPLLDTPEALGCGIVNKLGSIRHVWHSFGLEVDYTRLTNNRSNVPTFNVRDSEQVLPFLAKGAHELFQAAGASDEESQSSSSSGSDLDENVPARRRHRRGSRHRTISPAKVRFANTLIIVHIHGTPSTLPLPTLSKGRLPMETQAIDTALELGLTQCLRMLQRANPYLLLSTGLLQSSERDARYVPHLAASVVSILQRFESRSNKGLLQTIANWEQDVASGSDSDDTGKEKTALVDLVEARIRQRLVQAKITEQEPDNSQSRSDSSSNGEPTNKKAYQGFFSSDDDDSSSSAAGKISGTIGNNEVTTGGDQANDDDDDFTDLDDWL